MALRRVVLVCVLVGIASCASLGLSVSSNGAYSVSVNGTRWFAGSAITLQANNKAYSSMDGSLKLSSMHQYGGSDSTGDYTATTFNWMADSTPFITTFRAYDSTVIFEQVFPNGAGGTSVGNRDAVLSVFPSVETSSTPSGLGFLQFQGDMTGDAFITGQWPKNVGGGIFAGGPLAVFDATASHVVVMSPFSNFMAASVSTQNASRLEFGVMGAVTSIPAGYVMEFIFHLDAGINNAFETWGDVLLERYGKDRKGIDFDYTLTHLGYSTDNGAYYYYWTEPGKDYQQTLLDLKTYAASVQLPYKYILLDSWWYYKGVADGVKTWDAMPSIFPSGLDYMWNNTDWPVQGHNRYWATDNTYAKQNGGQWDFIIDNSTSSGKMPIALPTDPAFWDWLFSWARHWGLITYEQDWLDTTFDNLLELSTSATLGRDWLMQFGTAAARQGLKVQYCMAYCRHILQSVELPAVTNARASNDYSADHYDQWSMLGTTGIFAHAIGIAPSKDNYWSETVQPGNPWGPGREEPLTRLQSAVSSVSRGPVAPSDRIGNSNAALIMRACTAGGTLLRPDKPATNIDAHFLQSALGGRGPNGELWTTYSTVSRARYYTVLAAELQGDYNLTLNDIGALPADSFVAYEANSTSTLVTFDATHPLWLKSCSAINFQYYSVAPVLGNGWVLLGEQDKWIAAASERFKEVKTSDTLLIVSVTGTPGETVNVAFLPPGQHAPVTVSCVVPPGSTYRIIMPDKQCVAV